MTTLTYSSVDVQRRANLDVVAQQMFWLMLRNVATEGYVFQDPIRDGVLSRPGCILASPTFENQALRVRQNYVYNWTRDSAVAAIELAAGPLVDDQPLLDYVTFARACQQSGRDLDRASWLIDGGFREGWSNQSDGPAMQTTAVLCLYDRLDAATQAVARELIAVNLAYLRQAYRHRTINLWEERAGHSFFARSVQLRCLLDVRDNGHGVPVPDWIPEAITWLRDALPGHWDGAAYASLLEADAYHHQPYDPNIDVVLAAVYGAVPVTDPKLLATAVKIRAQWEDEASPWHYAINRDDRLRTPPVGPLLGRYPGDVYDGDTDALVGNHPWALCTAAYAELTYRLAADIAATGVLPADPLAVPFLTQCGVPAGASSGQAVAALRADGDRMLQALIYHSDHLELSEQFDGWTGFCKSVRNLTWSYAAFLSAVRARRAVPATP